MSIALALPPPVGVFIPVSPELSSTELAARTAYGRNPQLYPSLSGAAALRRIGRACLDQLAANEAGALAGSPQAVHQMRVGVRRLRAVLGAFSGLLPERERRAQEAELRWLGAVLGEARNLDVVQATLTQAAAAHRADPAVLLPLLQALEGRLRRAYGEMRYAIHSPRFAALQGELTRWLDEMAACQGSAAPPLAAPIGELAPAILDRRRRAVKQRGKGFAHQSAERRHRLRIALKKLRYASESLGSLYDPNDLRSFLQRLKTLQDGLGDANDLAVGHEIVAELVPAGGNRFGAVLLRRQEKQLAAREPGLRKHLDRLLDVRPFWRA